MTLNRFSEFMSESLTAQMMTEPSSKAAAQAKQMNLTYVGFARYADKSGKVKYIVKDDKLYPFKGKDVEAANIDNADAQIDQSVVKGNKEAATILGKKQKQAVAGIVVDEKNKKEYFKQNTNKVLAYNQQLSNLYTPDLFTSDEVEALRYYTQEGYNDINRYLYKGFDPDTTPEQADQIVQQIQSIDNAFEEAGAPFDYTTYTGLSSRYDFRKLRVGKDYIFRGYISTTLDHDTAIDVFTFIDDQQVGVILEIDVKQGQKAIYLENITDNEAEFETLLPRGTKVRVLAGPMMMDGNDTASDNQMGKQVALFKCSIVEE